MLTIFADPIRRYHTEGGGIRFLLEPISFQAAQNLPHEYTDIEARDFNINLNFEPCDAGTSLRRRYRDVPSHIGTEATTIFPQPLGRLIIAAYTNSEFSQNALSDVERAFSYPHLKLALTWTDQSGGHLEKIGAWLVGLEPAMPDEFWSARFPEVALVKPR